MNILEEINKVIRAQDKAPTSFPKTVYLGKLQYEYLEKWADHFQDVQKADIKKDKPAKFGGLDVYRVKAESHIGVS